MTPSRLPFHPKGSLRVYTTHVVTPRWGKAAELFAVATIKLQRQQSHHVGPTIFPLGPCGRLVLCFHVTGTANLFYKTVQQRHDKER